MTSVLWCHRCSVRHFHIWAWAGIYVHGHDPAYLSLTSQNLASHAQQTVWRCRLGTAHHRLDVKVCGSGWWVCACGWCPDMGIQLHMPMCRVGHPMWTSQSVPYICVEISVSVCLFWVCISRDFEARPSRRGLRGRSQSPYMGILPIANVTFARPRPLGRGRFLPTGTLLV